MLLLSKLVVRSQAASRYVPVSGSGQILGVEQVRVFVVGAALALCAAKWLLNSIP